MAYALLNSSLFLQKQDYDEIGLEQLLVESSKLQKHRQGSCVICNLANKLSPCLHSGVSNFQPFHVRVRPLQHEKYSLAAYALWQFYIRL